MPVVHPDKAQYELQHTAPVRSRQWPPVGRQPASGFAERHAASLVVHPHRVLGREVPVQNFTRHAAEIDQVCRELGISIHQLPTSQPLELTLFDFVQSRMHGGRQTVRAANRAAAAGRAG